MQAWEKGGGLRFNPSLPLSPILTLPLTLPFTFPTVNSPPFPTINLPPLHTLPFLTLPYFLTLNLSALPFPTPNPPPFPTLNPSVQLLTLPLPPHFTNS